MQYLNWASQNAVFVMMIGVGLFMGLERLIKAWKCSGEKKESVDEKS